MILCYIYNGKRIVMKKNIKLTKSDIKKFIQYRKLEIKYSILILVFIMCVFTITATILIINYNELGTSHIIKDYYDIKLVNASMDYTTLTSVKLEDNRIVIDIKDLGIYKNENSINVEMRNIGNLDALVNYINITKNSFDVKKEDVNVNMSIKQGDIIESAETKIININIKCNNKKVKNNDSMIIIIDLSFNEIEK